MTQDTITVPRQRIRHVRGEARPRYALYWAYGSNLNLRHMAGRCPASEPYEALYLQHGRLTFRGVADVTVTPGAMVPGGLFWITQDCERALDAFEGVRARVYLKRYFQVEIDGSPEEVLFYQMQTSRGIMPPSETYLRTIEGGYRDFGLDLAYLSDALERAWAEKDVTPMLRQRHERRGRPRLARTEPAFVLTEDELKAAGAV